MEGSSNDCPDGLDLTEVRRSVLADVKKEQDRRLAEAESQAALINSPGVFTLEDVPPFDPLEALAGISSPCPLADKNPSRSPTSGTFDRRFSAFHPGLKIMITFGGICAGGRLADILMAPNIRRPGGLFDFFFLEGADPLFAADKLGRFLVSRESVSYCRTENAIVFRTGLDSGEIMLIRVLLRCFPNIEAALSNYRLGSHAVAWDGRRVWLNRRSAFAIQYGVEIYTAAESAEELAISLLMGYGIKGLTVEDDIAVESLVLAYSGPSSEKHTPVAVTAARLMNLVFPYWEKTLGPSDARACQILAMDAVGCVSAEALSTINNMIEWSLYSPVEFCRLYNKGLPAGPVKGEPFDREIFLAMIPKGHLLFIPPDLREWIRRVLEGVNPPPFPAHVV